MGLRKLIAGLLLASVVAAGLSACATDNAEQKLEEASAAAAYQAQEDAAEGDLNNIAVAQAMSRALNGKYMSSIEALRTGSGGITTGFVASAGVATFTATSAAGDSYLAVTKSSAGTYFARINDSSAVGQGASLSEALAGAGATTEWASANGIVLPDSIIAAGVG